MITKERVFEELFSWSYELELEELTSGRWRGHARCPGGMLIIMESAEAVSEECAGRLARKAVERFYPRFYNRVSWAVRKHLFLAMGGGLDS